MRSLKKVSVSLESLESFYSRFRETITHPNTRFVSLVDKSVFIHQIRD